MATTIKGLKTAFKKAESKVVKSIARYKSLLFKLYMPAYPNCRKSDASKDLCDVYLTCLRSDGTIRDYATDLSHVFYRRGRGGKFYIKPQNELFTYCESCPGQGHTNCPYCNDDRLVGQDYIDLCKLEAAIEAAVDERERVIDELESLGYDVYHDSDLWG